MQRVFIFTCLLLLPLEAMSAICSSLALAFSKSSDALTLDDLSVLRKCINDKLYAKTDKLKGPSHLFEKPEPSCSSLALAFSKNSDALTLDDLSVLRKCINDKLYAKTNELRRPVPPQPPPP